MKKAQKKKNGSSAPYRWALTAFLMAVTLSAVLSLASESMLDGAGVVVAVLILAMFIGLGIVFDVIGVAATAADPKPFHSMAAHKEKGAKESLYLLRNASRVSSVCNDVVGDICGVVSGSASATIAAQILSNFELSFASVVPLMLSSLVAALTVGGKAVGKGIAVSSCTEIVFHAGQVIYAVTHVKELFQKNSKKKK